MKNIDWENLNILVTGGTGSFGKKLIDIMLRDFHPNKLIIFSRDELKQHEMRMNGFDYPCLRYFIGDVRDKERLHRAMQGVNIIIHAAALKQVPACEYNPFEAVKTNVLGAQNIIDAAIDEGVEKVVALSTDKAVNPVNLYGATKLCAEKMFIQGNSYAGVGGTMFSCVRYGNVIGSRGSVIPLFMSQKENGRIIVVGGWAAPRLIISLGLQTTSDVYPSKLAFSDATVSGEPMGEAAIMYASHRFRQQRMAT